MIRIQRIERSDPLYAQEVELRQRVLLDPIGISMDDLERIAPGGESRFEHIVATVQLPSGVRVVGCVCLLADVPEEGWGKLMQMAVDPQRQREGVGRRLVAEFERRALGELGLEHLYCHARTDASGFYERMGWVVEGPGFEEAGIPHLKMVLRP